MKTQDPKAPYLLYIIDIGEGKFKFGITGNPLERRWNHNAKIQEIKLFYGPQDEIRKLEYCIQYTFKKFSIKKSQLPSHMKGEGYSEVLKNECLDDVIGYVISIENVVNREWKIIREKPEPLAYFKRIQKMEAYKQIIILSNKLREKVCYLHYIEECTRQEIVDITQASKYWVLKYIRQDNRYVMGQYFGD